MGSVLPRTFVDLGHNLGKNKIANRSSHHEKEHEKNLKAMRSHVQNIGNSLDRKKNRFDPLNDPVRLFRKDKSEAEKVSINAFKKKMETRELKTKEMHSKMAE